jgi:hypothetical protein
LPQEGALEDELLQGLLTFGNYAVIEGSVFDSYWIFIFIPWPVLCLGKSRFKKVLDMILAILYFGEISAPNDAFIIKS